jgi:MFS family permease
MTGTWMQRSAQVWLVYMMTDSPFLLGLLGVVQFTPMIVLSLFAGVIVDRYPKKKIIRLVQTGLMIQSLILAALVWSGHAQYWHVLLLAAVYGCLQTIDFPARQSWFVNLVGIADLPNAISLNSTVVTLAKIIGPLIAGAVMIRFGIAFCFFINAISYSAIFIVLKLIKASGEPEAKNGKSVARDIKDGLGHIASSLTLRSTLMVMTTFCIFAMNSSMIVPVFADTVLLRGVNGYTTLLSATGIGALFGALYMANRAEAVKCGRLVLDAVLMALVQIAAAFSTNYLVSLALMVVIGFFTISFLNMANSILQVSTTDSYRGRVMSVYTLVNHGSISIGNLFTGSLMERYGAASGFAGCGTMVLVLIGLLFILTPMKDYIHHCRKPAAPGR